MKTPSVVWVCAPRVSNAAYSVYRIHAPGSAPISEPLYTSFYLYRGIKRKNSDKAICHPTLSLCSVKCSASGSVAVHPISRDGPASPSLQPRFAGRRRNRHRRGSATGRRGRRDRAAPADRIHPGTVCRGSRGEHVRRGALTVARHVRGHRRIAIGDYLLLSGPGTIK